MSRWIFTASSAESSVTAQSSALTRMIQKIPTSTKVVIIQDPPLPTNIEGAGLPVDLSDRLPPLLLHAASRIRVGDGLAGAAGGRGDRRRL